MQKQLFIVNRTFFDVVTIRKQSCGKVMFSQASVKNYVHGGEVSTPPGRHPPEQTPPVQIPPQQTAAAADGTHPTGMHSCCQ